MISVNINPSPKHTVELNDPDTIIPMKYICDATWCILSLFSQQSVSADAVYSHYPVDDDSAAQLRYAIRFNLTLDNKAANEIMDALQRFVNTADFPEEFLDRFTLDNYTCREDNSDSKYPKVLESTLYGGKELSVGIEWMMDKECYEFEIAYNLDLVEIEGNFVHRDNVRVPIFLHEEFSAFLFGAVKITTSPKIKELTGPDNPELVLIETHVLK